jgi:hypothetical protein
MPKPDPGQSASPDLRPAEFSVRSEQRTDDSPMYPTHITECWCGWSTTAVDSSLYGPPNARMLAMLAHRIAHLEGRVDG